jgi:hypothetical protein
MPVDSGVLKAKISKVNFAVNELRRLISKPFTQLNVDEKYSIFLWSPLFPYACISLLRHTLRLQ